MKQRNFQNFHGINPISLTFVRQKYGKEGEIEDSINVIDDEYDDDDDDDDDECTSSSLDSMTEESPSTSTSFNNVDNNNRPFSFGISPNHTIPSTAIICDSSFEQQQPSLSIAATIQLPEPPPSYDLSSQDMPPSYDEAIAQQQQQQIPKNY